MFPELVAQTPAPHLGSVISDTRVHSPRKASNASHDARGTLSGPTPPTAYMIPSIQNKTGLIIKHLWKRIPRLRIRERVCLLGFGTTELYSCAAHFDGRKGDWSSENTCSAENYVNTRPTPKCVRCRKLHEHLTDPQPRSAQGKHAARALEEAFATN